MSKFKIENSSKNFLIINNELLNKNIKRNEINFNNVNNDLIFMQLDVDCDVINKYKCKINFNNIL
jgi:hypothetical protein